jgi:hypothetical protein
MPDLRQGCATGKSTEETTPADALVLFGAMGDLAHKKIFPALYHLVPHGHLDVPVIGIARAARTDDHLKERVRDSIHQQGGEIDQEALARLLTLLRYVGGDYERPETFDLLKKRSARRAAQCTIWRFHQVFSLLSWYEVTPYKKPSDYAWATDANRAGAKRGKQPVWLSTVMRDYIQPAARKLGINKKVSWHTFRDTFSTLLKGNGEDVKMVQELLRHSTAKMTLDTYAQALSPQKRAAQRKVVGVNPLQTKCTVVVPRVSGEIPVTH